ncbi:N-acetylneuraminate lyase [Neobacillus niacini]|uniref:N-acetylneuraminate lyase n=1 Tax=Neobacillus niacini TaxID=86668 RepID=UPI003000614C
MDKFKGVFPALVTPFKENGEIHEESLRKIVSFNIDKGVKGFYVNGSTAETFVLTTEEKKRLIDIVADEAKGRATLIYHVGNISTREAVELAKYGEQAKVDAISAIPPFYYKFGFEEIKGYYQDIMDSVNLPMIVYNFPAFSGVQFSMDQFLDLLQDDRVIGIKHTSMNLYDLERLQYGSKKIIFNGHDEVFLGGLSMGAIGGIGSTFNIMADKFVNIQKLHQEDRLEEAFAIQREANNVIDALVKVGVNQGVKYGLEKLGIVCNGCRKPFRNLTDEEKKYLDKVFADNHVIENLIEA